MLRRQKIVAVGREGGLLDQLEDLFAESAVDVQRFGNPEHALAVLDAFEVDLILVEHPLRKHSIREFIVDASDRPGGKNKKILVLAKQEALSEIVEKVGDRYPVVVEDEPRLLRKRVAPHLKSFPARAKRLMATMTVHVGGVERQRMAQTENISETGVLIRTREKLPVGREVDLELSLPGAAAPLRVVGEVRRYHETEDGQLAGLGVAFSRLTTDAANQLNAYLEQRLASVD